MSTYNKIDQIDLSLFKTTFKILSSSVTDY